MRTLLVAVLAGAAGCGDVDLNVSWSFESGDCASNGVEKIHVRWDRSEARFDCSESPVKLTPMGAVDAVGLDAAGVERVRGSATIAGRSTDITLRPKPADVTVTWAIDCPAGLALFITIYEAPPVRLERPTVKVKEAQSSCESKTVTFTGVPSGNYIVDVSSRVSSPDLQGQKPLLLIAGENATVDFGF